ncbi:hypothetical protein OROGR_014250 [Orobanche gracilis]
MFRSSHGVKVVVRFLEKDQVFALSLSSGNVVEALLPIKNKGNGTRTCIQLFWIDLHP